MIPDTSLWSIITILTCDKQYNCMHSIYALRYFDRDLIISLAMYIPCSIVLALLGIYFARSMYMYVEMID